MGAGMVHNLLLNEYEVNILAHKNRAPIDRLVSSGATELCSLKDIAHQSDIIILCLPNSKTVRIILRKIISDVENGTLLIDSTTNSVEAVNQFQAQAVSGRFRYAEAPLTGGQAQAETATLGAIVGCARKDFEEVKTVLGPCCQTIERFGDIGSGAKAKINI